jgi:hypothetical protein
VAKYLPRRQEAGIAEVAERVGYGSASAFSTAFGRMWRRHRDGRRGVIRLRRSILPWGAIRATVDAITQMPADSGAITYALSEA